MYGPIKRLLRGKRPSEELKLLEFLHRNTLQLQELVNEIPPNLLSYLTSARRFKKGWFLNPFQNKFIELSIKLAFRKHEVEISDGNNEIYKEEIESLREQVSDLIEKQNSNYPK